MKQFKGFSFFNKFAYNSPEKIGTGELLTPDSMYILKVKGTAKIPDYVQLRDDQFTLLAYFRVDRSDKALVKAGLAGKEEQIKKLIDEIPYGKMQKLEI